jgi:phenylacetate-coenzyme A ligase PaaK-like adenylate-forming protein
VNSRLIIDVLRTRRQHRRREQWTRDELDVFQRRALGELRSFAVEHSAFYRRIHRGLDGRPLEELPVVTKHDLMGAFDEFVTDSRVRLRDVESYLAAAHGDTLFHDRYWIARTSGTTGHPGIVAGMGNMRYMMVRDSDCGPPVKGTAGKSGVSEFDLGTSTPGCP